MQLEEFVSATYNSLSYNEQQVATFLLKNKQALVQMTSEEISLHCGISRPTLLRTLKKIGINSVSELKYLVQGDNNTYPETMNIQDIAFHYQHMIKDIFSKNEKEICNILLHARQIYLYGTGNEQKHVVEEMKRMLLALKKRSMDFFDYGEIDFQKSNFHSQDVFIIISLSGETQVAIDIIKHMKPTGVQLISFTKLKNNTISRMCDYNLYVGTKTIPIQSNEGYEIMTSFYVLLDHLMITCLAQMEELTHDI